MLLENLVSGGVTLVSIIGVFAFFLSIVVQLTKDFVPKKIPTKLYVLVLSLVITVVGVLCYLQYTGVDIKLYHIVGSVVLSFIIAFISMYGWEELNELKNRFVKK